MSPRTRTVRTNTKEVDRGSPSGHSRRGLGAIRGVRLTRRVLKHFFSAGVDKAISRVLLVSCFLNPLFFKMLVLIHTYLVENGTVCHTSEFFVQGQVWGTSLSKFGRAASSMPCLTRACVKCNAMFPPPQKKNEWPPVLTARVC